MTPKDVLALVAEDAKMERVKMTVRHGRQRMNERNAQVGDVRSALMTAKMARYNEKNDTWKITGGTDIDGDDLTVVVALDPTRVVSVF